MSENKPADLMSTSRQRQQAILICVCLAVLIAAVYWPVRHAGFLNYDDDEYVTANPHVLGGLTVPAVVWAFTAYHAANWHPLTWLSHALDCEFFGMNAGGHHAVNVLLHVANTVLLFWVLRRMTGATWRSACVAALFGVHPLHVESVAWVAERKDVLSGLFWMLALWGYVRYVERPTRGRYVMVVGCYAMGLMAKPMVVTLPFVLLLLDYWPLGRTRWMPSVVGNNARLRLGELVREKIPFFALAAVSCGVTIWAQHSGGAISSLEQLPLGLRMANAVVSYVRYIEKAVWPSGLAVFYPYRAWPPGDGDRSGGDFGGGVGRGDLESAARTASGRGVVLVLGDVGAGDWIGAGREPVHGGPVYVSAVDWVVHHAVLERAVPRAGAAEPESDYRRRCGGSAGGLRGVVQSSGRVLERLGDTVSACSGCDPGQLAGARQPGNRLDRTGRVQEAIAHYEQALRIKPGFRHGAHQFWGCPCRHWAGCRKPSRSTSRRCGSSRIPPRRTAIWGSPWRRRAGCRKRLPSMNRP